jgi:hypothetical protein
MKWVSIARAFFVCIAVMLAKGLPVGVSTPYRAVKSALPE